MEIAYKESIPVHKYDSSKSKKTSVKKSLEKSEKKLMSNFYCQNYNLKELNNEKVKNESSECP